MGWWSSAWDGIKDAGQGLVDGVSGKSQRDAIEKTTNAQLGFQQQALDLVKPFYDFGVKSLPGIESSATLEGFGNGLGDIFNSPMFQQLAAEKQKAGQASLMSSGLSRSSYGGERMGEIPISTAFGIEDMLRGRQYQNAGIATGAGSQMGSIFGNMGNITGQGIMGGAAAEQGGVQNLLGLLGSIGSIFSDERLKDQMAVVGNTKGLNIYAWEWTDKAKELYGLEGANIGFSAQEIKELHPDLVAVNDEGYFKIDIDQLLERIA